MNRKKRGRKAPPSGPSRGRGRGRGASHPPSSSSSSTARGMNQVTIAPAPARPNNFLVQIGTFVVETPEPAVAVTIAPLVEALMPARPNHFPFQIGTFVVEAPTTAVVVEAPVPAPAVAVTIAPMVEAPVPARPGFGTVGTKSVIKANHFLVEIAKKDLYQYNVTISPHGTSKSRNREIMRIFTKSYRAELGNLMLVYDGKKSAFAAGSLPFRSQEFVIDIADLNGRIREFKVSIEFAARKDLRHLREFSPGLGQQDHPQETIQALEVLLRESVSIGKEILGRSAFHSYMGSGQLGDGVEFWKGFYQALRPIQMGLSMCVDISARAFFEGTLVSDFVREFLGRDISTSLSDTERIKVKKALRGIRVEVEHEGFLRRYKVEGLTDRPTSQLNFVHHSGTKSVTQYFRDRYNIDVKFPSLPAIQAGKNSNHIYLPMEICRIASGQKYGLKLSEKQVTEFLRVTCKRPQQREINIKNIIWRNDYKNDELVSTEFGMDVIEQPISIEARVLPPPLLRFRSPGESYSELAEVNPALGQWNMPRLINGGRVNHWTIINFSRHKEDAVLDFVNKLVSTCLTKGIDFNSQPLIGMICASPNKLEKALADLHSNCAKQLAQKAPSEQLQMLFVILPEAAGTYPRIKLVCETELGIISQCCKPEHIIERSDHYFENVALKINVKVGGRNFVLAAALTCRLPKVTDCVAIIIGAYVTHPEPGDDSSPSIAGVVASMDWPEMTKYKAVMSTQPPRQEIISDLYTRSSDPKMGVVHGGLIRELLISFYKSNRGLKPRRIIYYRDGVSEGKKNEVLLNEMDMIRKACQSIEGFYLPPVTFIVVEKGHHTRFFPEEHGDKASTDKSGNVLPGTVVDTKICHPSEFDFYLCSHAGIQGTSRPTHYHVLFDENKFKADDLQMLTNNLCYTYQRCTRSVSIVAPAYYARLAAFRARTYLEGDLYTPNTTDNRVANVRLLPVIHQNVKSEMFYC